MADPAHLIHSWCIFYVSGSELVITIDFVNNMCVCVNVCEKERVRELPENPDLFFGH